MNRTNTNPVALNHISRMVAKAIAAHPEYDVWDSAEDISSLFTYLDVETTNEALVLLRRADDAELDEMSRIEEARMGRIMRAASRRGVL